jgi:hypothetical protein
MVSNIESPSRGRNVVLGAAGGFAAALIIIAFGLVKFLILRHQGAPLKAISFDDVRVLLFYVGGFVLAGGFVGASRPILSSGRKTYSVFAAAGAIAMNFLALSDGLARMHWFSFVMFSVLGAIVGLAVAFGVRLASAAV